MRGSWVGDANAAVQPESVRPWSRGCRPLERRPAEAMELGGATVGQRPRPDRGAGHVRKSLTLQESARLRDVDRRRNAPRADRSSATRRTPVEALVRAVEEKLIDGVRLLRGQPGDPLPFEPGPGGGVAAWIDARLGTGVRRTLDPSCVVSRSRARNGPTDGSEPASAHRIEGLRRGVATAVARRGGSGLRLELHGCPRARRKHRARATREGGESCAAREHVGPSPALSDGASRPTAGRRRLGGRGHSGVHRRDPRTGAREDLVREPSPVQPVSSRIGRCASGIFRALAPSRHDDRRRATEVFSCESSRAGGASILGFLVGCGSSGSAPRGLRR